MTFQLWFAELVCLGGASAVLQSVCTLQRLLTCIYCRCDWIKLYFISQSSPDVENLPFAEHDRRCGSSENHICCGECCISPITKSLIITTPFITWCSDKVELQACSRLWNRWRHLCLWLVKSCCSDYVCHMMAADCKQNQTTRYWQIY